ncbi:MAG: hypothetical protein H7Y09_11275 [Chitinophagaceae bacterium]|nr:hypothetical protein [Anaerolineae bacterium]
MPEGNDEMAQLSTDEMPKITPQQSLRSKARRLSPQRLLTGAMPHQSVSANNAVFRYEARRIPTAQELEQRTVFWMLRVVALLTGLWLVGVMVIIITPKSDMIGALNYTTPLAVSVYNAMGQFIQLAFLLSFLDKFVLDFIAILTALPTISDDIKSGHWELTALTGLNMRKLVEAKHAVAQTRAWRTMCSVAGFRLGVVTVMVLHTLILPFAFPSNNGYVPNPLADLFSSSSAFIDERIFIFWSFLAYIFAAIVYVIEPRWRLQAVTMGGVAVSTQEHQSAGALFSAFGCLIGVWLVQIVIAVLAGCSLLWTGGTFLSTTTSGWGALVLIMYVAMVGAGIYQAYASLTGMWRSAAVRRLVKRGGAL